jgi:oligopeptide transport system substrate-binding protein
MFLNLILVFTLGWNVKAIAHESFKFHLLSEPHNLDPQASASASGNYLFHNLYRGLYVYSRSEGLRPVGASNCRRSKLKMTCTLRPSLWSDGKPIVAQNYLDAFRRLIDPEHKSPQADVLFSLKNAREIWSGKMKPAELGLEAPSANTLVFHFAEEEPEFEYRLIHPALSPMPPGGFRAREDAADMPVSGPYKVSEWKRGAWVKLQPNEKYSLGNPQRPPAEAFFIDEDSTALRLFESGKLTFLRRLVAAEFPRFRDKPEFHQIPMARFDYVGFGPALIRNKEARFALVRGIEFSDFLRLFGARSAAGCPALPAHFMDKVNCLGPDFKAARASVEKAGPMPKLIMQFSKMGGDDIVRAVEWFQGQWKKNLGWSIELRGQEQAVYLAQLRERPPAIFRKGVNLDRPTCLAALEIFLKGHPENFIALDDPKFEKLVGHLRKQVTLPARKKACREAVDHLLTLDRLIPLGEMHFTVLASPKFKGWELNELNQLDLSQLSAP